MANPLVAGQILEVKVCCLAADQIALNIYHYHVDAAGAAADDTDVLTELGAAFLAKYVVLICNDAVMYGTQVQIIAPTPKVAVFDFGDNPGTGGATALPRQVCGLIRKRTGLPGRKYRGRAYIPFPATGALGADETPDAGYVAGLDDLASIVTTFSAGAGTDAFALTGCLLHVDSSDYTPLTSCDGSPKWATQRRRGDYGRPNARPWP